MNSLPRSFQARLVRGVEIGDPWQSPRKRVWVEAVCLRALLMCVGVLAFVAPCAWAHDPVHNLIVAKSREVEACGADRVACSELLRQRGELYRQVQDWDRSHRDLRCARDLDRDNVEVELSSARLFWDLGWVESARASVERYLQHRPQSLPAHLLLAEVLFVQKQFIAAAAEFERALRLQEGQLGRAEPDLLLRRAEALSAAGPAYWSEAVDGLDSAIQKLGPIVTLELYALELEVQQEDWQAALQRIDDALRRSDSPAMWWVRKGELLLHCKRRGEAQQAFQKALHAIEILPGLKRRVLAVKQLKERAQLGWERTQERESLNDSQKGEGSL